jgi:hypothetical protein
MNQHTEEQLPTNEYEPDSLFPRFMTGFLLGFALPGAFGAYGMYREYAYRASLPECLNCGNCGLSALLLINFVAPV